MSNFSTFSGFTEDPSVLEAYRSDREREIGGMPACVLRPSTTQEISEIISLAVRERTPVVTRGTGTGLSGGANALDGSIVLSTERMDKILNLDPANRTVEVQSGVVNAAVKKTAQSVGLRYAPDPGSWRMSSIGGNIATNAGGMCCFRDGITQHHVREVEFVDGQGRIHRFGKSTRKNAVGLNLIQLAIGSEGSLGVITSAVLQLVPRQEPQGLIMVALRSPGDLAEATGILNDSSGSCSAIEFLDSTAISYINSHFSADLPQPTNGLLMVLARTSSLDSFEAQLRNSRQRFQTWTVEDPNSAEDLFSYRSHALIAIEKQGRVWTEDICVPATEIESALKGIRAISRRLSLNIPVVAHAADGNLHPMIVESKNVSHNDCREAFNEILSLAVRLGGVVTGEHGVGTIKRDKAMASLSADTLALSTSIKRAFDPFGIMNPGKGCFYF